MLQCYAHYVIKFKHFYLNNTALVCKNLYHIASKDEYWENLLHQKYFTSRGMKFEDAKWAYSQMNAYRYENKNREQVKPLHKEIKIVK
jgi:hypothetical protein